MIKEYKFLIGAGISGLSVGLGLGLAVGIFLTNKKFETKYDKIARQEIAEAKKFYSVLYKKDKYATTESTVENRKINEAVKAVRSYQGENDNEVENTDVVNNIFVNSLPIEEDEFDYDAEVKNRNSDTPYIVTKEEFLEAEAEFEQTTLTYFMGDDVLSDDKDQPINDSDSTVGDENLMRFGHGSGDPHIVYIRNEKLQLEFEVVCSKGKYTEDVLGFIQHDDHRKIRKFRDDDG